MKKEKIVFCAIVFCALASLFVACKKDDDKDKTVTCTCEDYEGDRYTVNPANYGYSTCAQLTAASGGDEYCW